MAPLPNVHHEIGGVFRVCEPGGVDCVDARDGAGGGLLFNAQTDARPLGKTEGLRGAECALAEDGIDVAGHGGMISAECGNTAMGQQLSSASVEIEVDQMSDE